MKKEKFRLLGGTALITGASSGIGKEIAKILIKERGMTVIGIGRSKEKLLAVQSELGKEDPLYSSRFIPLSADISLRQNWAEIRRFVESRGEKLALFVSNAGVLPAFAGERVRGVTAAETMEKTVQTNLFAAVYGTETLRPLIKPSGGVVFIASSAALCTMPGVAAYAASKSALKAYAETLIAERSFCYVGLMLPGFTKTDVMRNQPHKASGEEIGKSGASGKKQSDANGIQKGDVENGKKGSEENGGNLIDRISSPADKMARGIVRAMAKEKRRKILGADAKGMYLLSRIFPRSAPSIIGRVLKKSGYALFKNVF